jgi:hypothetical protein
MTRNRAARRQRWAGLTAASELPAISSGMNLPVPRDAAPVMSGAAIRPPTRVAAAAALCRMIAPTPSPVSPVSAR